MSRTDPRNRATQHAIETNDDVRPRAIDVALGVAAIAMVLLGVVIRMRLYLGPDALDTDEQLLALNVLTRSMGRFWEPLELGQTAAPLFLVAAKVGVELMGVGEASFRLWAILAGCAALPAVWLVGRRLLAPEENLLAVTLLAVAHAHIFYSSFFKPYTTDALVAIVLVGMGLAALKRPTVPRFIALGVAASVCLLVSTTAVFVVGGVGLGAVVTAARRRSALLLVTVVGLAVLWAGVFLWLMHSSHADLGDPSTPAAKFMDDFWQGYFLFHGRSGMRLSAERIASNLLDTLFFGVPLFVESPSFWTAVLAVGVVLGILACTKRHGIEVGVLLGAPLALLLLASAMRRYPASTRLVLFSAPISAIGLAAGVGWILSRVPRLRRVGMLGLIATVLAVRALTPLPSSWSSAQRMERRAIVETIAGRTRARATVYLFPASLPAWLYFATDWRMTNPPLTHRLIRAVDLDGPATLFRPMPSLIGGPPSVTDEDLTMPWNQGTLLVGRTSGVRSRSQLPGTLEHHWATREAHRIRRTGSCVDVLLIDVYPAESAALESAIREAGGLITDRRRTPRDLAYRACFS